MKDFTQKGEITPPDIVLENVKGRKAERAHLLGLLRIRLIQLKKLDLTPAEIYQSIDMWIANRSEPIKTE